MENWSDKQQDTFGKLFDALKSQKDPSYKTDAITALKMNGENFTKLFKDTVQFTGDQEDIELCLQRAKHLGIE
jgi:hypothetical protein